MGHGGYLPPYESFINVYPDLNLGVFITINGPGPTVYSAMPVNTVVHGTIFDILQGRLLTDIFIFLHFYSKILRVFID